MTTSSRESHVFRFSETAGVDLRSSDLRKSPGFLSALTNAIYNSNDDIESRPGYKAIAASCGGHGLGVHNRFSTTTGLVTSALVAVSNTVEKLTEYTLTVTYSGSNQCTVSVYFDTATTQYKFKIVETSTTKLDQALGVGFDEASPVTISTLATAISAISGGLFTATASGATSTPAAFLPITDSLALSSSLPAVLTYLSAVTVNSPIAGMLTWYEDNKNSAEFVNCVPIQYRNSLFFPNPGTYGLLKYDGQTLYKAGLPTITTPTVAEVNASAGVAEVTSIVCTAEATAAEVTKLVTIADTSAKATHYMSGINSRSYASTVNYNNDYLVLYGIASGVVNQVVFWCNVDGSGSQPTVPGTTRYVQIALSTGNSGEDNATAITTAIDGEAEFVLVSYSGGNATFQGAATGTVSSGYWSEAVGTTPVGFLTTNNGADGLHEKYFTIYDEDGMVVFWYDVLGGGIQPTVASANRYVEITTVTAGMSANDVATQTELATEADSKFTSTVSTNEVTVTDASSVLGTRTDATAGTTGFTVSVTTQGRARLHLAYFVLPDPSGTVAFWYDVDDVGGAEPAHGQTRAVEITTVTAGMTADQVAAETEAAIEADVYSSSVASATITVTDNAVGVRSPNASAGTTSFTVTTTTEGTATGLGGGIFKYKLTAIQRDANGVIIEGNPTSEVSIDFSASTKDAQISIQGIQATTGYNTGCAIVNGNQASATTITVDSGHTLKVGDQAYLYDSTASVLAYVTKTVTAIAATTITVNAAVSVTDNLVISNGLKIAIYRTEEDGSDFFLVVELPNDSINGSFLYTDSKPDAQLGEQYTAPVVDRSPPGSFKFLSIYKGVGVATGFDSDQDRVSFSDIDSLEYWPADTGEFVVDTTNGDRTSAVLNNNEACVIGKIGPDDQLGSVHVVYGTLDENAGFSVETKSQSLGIPAQSGIFDFEPGNSGYVTSQGVSYQVGGNMPTSISDRIRTVFEERDFGSIRLYLKRAVAINDAESERVMVFLPIEPESGTKYAHATSPCWVFDYSLRASGERASRWIKWTNINAAAGMVRIGADIYFSERRLSPYSGQVDHILYKMNRLGTSSDYIDHVSTIGSEITSFWEHDDAPSQFKDFKTIKLWSFSTASFSVTLNVYADYLDGNAIVTETVSFAGAFDDDNLVHISDGKTQAIKVNITHGQALQKFQLSGWEIQTAKTYRGVTE